MIKSHHIVSVQFEHIDLGKTKCYILQMISETLFDLGATSEIKPDSGFQRVNYLASTK